MERDYDYEEAAYWHTVSRCAGLINEYGLHKVLKDIMPLLDSCYLPQTALQCGGLYDELGNIQTEVVNKLLRMSMDD